MTLQGRNLILQRDLGNSYIRHLRAVQRISSRDVLTPKKQHVRYNSIIDMYHSRKQQTRSFALRESQDELKGRNNKILVKLLSISKKKPDFDFCENSQFIHSLNEPKRRREQEHIDQENAKLLKGILTQRPTVLPELFRSRRNRSVMGETRVEDPEENREAEKEGDKQGEKIEKMEKST